MGTQDRVDQGGTTKGKGQYRPGQETPKEDNQEAEGIKKEETADQEPGHSPAPSPKPRLS